MIHILLLILKILGIVLLALLSLILLILFFPISYKITGNLKEKSYNVKVSANWLFHLLHFGCYVDKNKRKYTLRLFGIPILKHPKKDKQKKIKKSKKDKHEETVEIKKADNEENIKEKQEATQKEVKEETSSIQSVDNMLSEEIEPRGQKEKCEKNAKNKRQKKSIIERIKRKIQRFISKIKIMFQKTKNTKDKISEIKKFLTANTTKEAYQYGKRIVIKMLKHIFPKKIRGNLHLGFETPDMTGKALGYIAIAFGTLHIDLRKMRIEPDFEHKIIEGSLKMKGHLMLGVVGIYLLRLYMKKEIKYIIKKFS